MRHFATCCHPHQFGVLLGSMRKHCRPFVLHALDWDAVAHVGADDLSIMSRADFLARHPEMAPERLPGPPRRPVDVVATVRWTWLADLLESIREPVTLLDGDIWLMSSPEPVFAEIGAARMAVTPHRIPPRSRGLPGVVLETHEVYGRYNAGWTYLADPEPAREMAAATRAWSYTEVVPRAGRRPLFGDQSALEEVAEKYGAHVIAHPGVNLGPWNCHNHRLAAGIYTDHPFVDGQPVVAYHFSSLRTDGRRLVQYANAEYEVPEDYKCLIYQPYLRALGVDTERT